MTYADWIEHTHILFAPEERIIIYNAEHTESEWYRIAEISDGSLTLEPYSTGERYYTIVVTWDELIRLYDADRLAR